MEKGTLTVRDIVENFNWTDVDFVIYKVKEVYFHDDGSCDGIYTTAVNERIDLGNIEEYYDMKIRDIDGGDSYKEMAVLSLWEDQWQYEEKAKQNNNWIYTA